MSSHPVQVHLQSITCLEEVNESSASGEPYVLVTTADLHPVVDGLPAPPNFEVFRYGIFEDFDEGETRKVDGPACWGPSSVPLRISDPSAAAIVVSLMENDNGTPEQYQELLRAATALSLDSSLGDPSPANRAARLTNSIRDALDGVELPIPFSLDDDHVGTAPLVLGAGDVAPNALGEKVMVFDNAEGRYQLVFQVKAFAGARWDKLDENPATIALASSAGALYQRHNSGFIFRFTGSTWEQLDNNPATVSIVADGNQLYQLHNSGFIFRFTGSTWEQLDSNPATVSIAASGGHLYQLHNSGLIFRFTGSTWEQLDKNPATVSIVADGDQLYQRHNSGFIFRFTGSTWEQLDSNSATVLIAASGGHLYQLHNSGLIFRFTGSTWEQLDNNPATVSIVADGDQLYQRHNSGLVFRSFAGGWQELDNNPATKLIVASAASLWQLHTDGSIWKARLSDL